MRALAATRNEGVQAALDYITAAHADPKKVEALEERDVHPKIATFALQRTNNDLEEAYQVHDKI